MSEYYYKEKGEVPLSQFDDTLTLHRVNGPAIIFPTSETWYFEGKLHRDNGPSASYFKIYKGKKIITELEWMTHGVPRTILPYYIYYDEKGQEIGHRFYYPENIGTDLPLEVWFDNKRLAYQRWGKSFDVSHRDNAPTELHFDSLGKIYLESWQKDGEDYREDELPFFTEHYTFKRKDKFYKAGMMQQMTQLSENNIHTKMFYKNGKLQYLNWFNSDYDHHRIDGPAKLVYDEDGKLLEEFYHIEGNLVSEIYHE